MLASPDLFEVIDLTYFQSIGGAGVAAGSDLERNVRLVGEIDIANVSNPEMDRSLARGQKPRMMDFPARESSLPEELLNQSRENLGRGFEADPVLARRVHTAARRLTFFERADDAWREMLPYERLSQFEIALTEDERTVRDRLASDVLAAISAHEGLSEHLLTGDALWLSTGEGDEQDFHAFRRFPVSTFHIEIGVVDNPYLETSPDHLELVHEAGARLSIDVDLMEVLERLREGFAPTLDESAGFLVNLDLFKNRLLAEPARELVLVGADRQVRVHLGAEPGSVYLTETVA